MAITPPSRPTTSGSAGSPRTTGRPRRSAGWARSPRRARRCRSPWPGRCSTTSAPPRRRVRVPRWRCSGRSWRAGCATAGPCRLGDRVRFAGAVLAFVGGVFLAVQGRLNGELGLVFGDGFLAALVSFGGGLVLLLLAVPTSRAGRAGVTRLAAALRDGRIRWWQCVGGACGAFFVSTQGLTVATLGVAVFTVAVVAAQTVSSLAVDRVGVGPAGRVPLTRTRVTGAVLAVVAVAVAVSDEVGDPADLWLALLPALAEAGQFERAFALVDAVAELSAAGLDRGRRADLHARLAMVANTAGRWTDAIAHVGTARTLLGADADDEREARLDALAAYTTMHLDEPNRIEATEFLARRAVDAAERVPLPEVGCEAWQLLGVLARERDLGEAAECFGRARALAEEHGLTIPRVHSVVRQASLAWLADGSPAELVEAREEALRVGAINLAYNVDCILGLDMVLHGHYGEAADRLARIAADTRRLQLKHLTLYVLMAQATAAAHQGRRAEVDAAIEAFDRVGGVGSQERPLCFGLARAFCALLEEDRAAAGQDLARAMAHEAETPTVYHLSGRHGMRLLLGALSGELDLDGYHAVTRSAAAGMRWNRVFARFALAVLLGRAGRGRRRARAVREAREARRPFRWPGTWGCAWSPGRGGATAGASRRVARTAEEYFTRPATRRWPARAAGGCARWARRCRSAAPAPTGCRACCARWA
ncbi:DMT family transporter [Saccharothrix sp. MB29]|nr:DMT family transporter [Saccharothrix sp. MB29]